MVQSDTSPRPRILDIGQCGFDHRTIARYFEQNFEARVESADTLDDAVLALRGGRFDLVLVNRVLDIDGSSGLELIRSLKSEPDTTLSAVPVVLVSNYPKAQEEARQLGAEPGFGKADLDACGTRDRLAMLLD